MLIKVTRSELPVLARGQLMILVTCEKAIEIRRNRNEK